MGDEKPRVVVLGTGWAGCRLMKDIDTKIYDVVCISPRNHMVFTPLLASTCVGTLEFLSVAEPIGRIQPAISREPGSYFFLSNCMGVDFQNHQVLMKNGGTISERGGGMHYQEKQNRFRIRQLRNQIDELLIVSSEEMTKQIQDVEEKVRVGPVALPVSEEKGALAGTLEEFYEAQARWGTEISAEQREKMIEEPNTRE